MPKRSDLTKARTNKKDEFYTQLVDIEKELKNYRKLFENKVVLCNCDDPYESNFFKYFALNFNFLKLKKLIATCYSHSRVSGTKMTLFDADSPDEPTKRAHKLTITEVEDYTGDGAVDMTDVEWLIKNEKNVLTELEGDGDFRSEECIELLKEADIVVTNPPFSLFREYVAQLMEFNKKFLIIGNINCLTYKEVFPLIQENKIWLGTGMGRWISGFIVPDNYELYGTEARINESGQRIVSTNNALWLTNLDHKKRHEQIDLYRAYNPDDYPTYDNFEGIEVSKTKNIPYDYKGIMGVPVTFLDKYNPEQFEIIGMGNGLFTPTKSYENVYMIKNGKEKKAGNALNRVLVYPAKGDEKIKYKAANVNYLLYAPYARILIRNKNPEEPLES